MSSVFQEETCASVITCSSDVLCTLPWLQLQIVNQRPNRKSSQWVRITLIGRDCKVAGTIASFCRIKTVFSDCVTQLPAMRPMTDDVLMMSPACMFSVAMIHLFRLPPATNAMSADLKTQVVHSIY